MNLPDVRWSNLAVVTFSLAALLSVAAGSGKGVPSGPGATPPPAAPAARKAGPIVIVPGKSIGEVHLGMPRAEVEALGLERHPRYAKMTIPYTVYYDAHGRVRGVEVSLEHAGREVTLEGRRIPGHATFAEAVAAVGGCEKPAPQTGGTVARCHGGVEVRVGGADPAEVWIRIAQPPAGSAP